MELIDYCLTKARQLPIEGRSRHYAVVVDKRGRILTEGANSYKEGCKLQSFYAKIVGLPEKTFNHAEINCLKQLKPYHKPDKIVVVRVGKIGRVLNSQPCKICTKALQSFNIKKIEHTL